MRLFFLILSLSIGICAHSQNKQALSKSDSLFAKGVELYNQGNYKAAIPLFTESDKIDKAELDSTSNRREYSAMWLGSCYYKLGDEEKAKEISTFEYMYPPTDRRLTVKSDSLAAIGVILFKQNEYRKALLHIQNCAEIEKQVLGDQHPYYANSLSNCSQLQTLLKDSISALQFAIEAKDIKENVYGHFSYQNLSETWNVATIYRDFKFDNNKEKAASLFLEAYQIADSLKLEYESNGCLREAAICYNHIGFQLKEENKEMERDYYDLALCNLSKITQNDNYSNKLRHTISLNKANSYTTEALLQKSLANYNKAIELAIAAISIQERTVAKTSPDYTASLNNLAGYYSLSGNYAEAIRLATEVLNLDEIIFGNEHPSYAIALSNLAAYKSAIGEYSEALDLEKNASIIYEKTLGKDHPTYAGSLSSIANYNSILGNYQEAISLNTEALKIYEKTLGKEHPTYSLSINRLAELQVHIGNYPMATKLFTQALETAKKSLGPNHSAYATILHNMATCISILGDDRKAITLEKEALSIREKALGKESDAYSVSLHSLAVLNSSTGNYVEAIKYETESLNIIKKTLGKNHKSYSTGSSCLASYYSALGNYEEAIRLDSEALYTIEQTFGKNHPDYANILSNLANDYYYYGNYLEASRLGHEALNIREKVLGTQHPDYAEALSNVSMFNISLGNLAEAKRQIMEASKIFQITFGQESHNYSIMLHKLALCNALQHNFSESIRLEKEVLKIFAKTIGKNHPDYRLALNDLTFYYFNSKDYINTAQQAILTTEECNKIVFSTFTDLTSHERTLFWNKYSNWYNYYLPMFSYYISEPELSVATYNGALLAKELLLNADREMSQLILESNDKAFIQEYRDLQFNKTILYKMLQKPKKEHITAIDSIHRIVRKQEKELITKSKVYGDYTRNLQITWKEVQKKLNKEDIAIEFLAFPAGKDSIIYAALILRPETTSPKMIPLFERKQLSNINKKDFYTTPTLSQLIWKPLEKELKGIKNVYFAPAGQLHNIAIEHLPSSDSTFIAEQINFYRLSSTRQLVMIKDKSHIKEAVLYGGLKYDADTTALVVENKKYTDIPRDLNIQHTFYPDSLNLRDGAKYLPATKIEAEQIKQALENTRLQPALYMDLRGTEESFKALSGKNISMLHIATHGFYWTETEARQTKDLDFLMMGDNNQSRYVEDKALTRSGLLLSGANIALKGNPLPEGLEDGILTAKELAGLDLRGLDLVVLSACQTGLGEITGDGVFGLQRGFKKAGANTLLMSLWKVDDNATQLLMTQFYKNLLAGKSKFESLREAQKYVRDYEVEIETTPDKRWQSEARQKEKQSKKPMPKEFKKIKKYKDPFYWAAFILLDAID
ncbi:MAG: tetratricopeptide repeat protein [Bacteroides sp.]|uniref:tetratricopeptide repeat protein n=1 Tax=Bacteroides sp. TaxID=29523 RepID=UPI00284A8D11|nr:tetratricopeptide repeat protein [Bacteroides sp.]MDR3823479.1 tetratricopeptide repeat protein [Bacteroides sp.]